LSTPTPDRKPANPLRGLAVGVFLALILFPGRAVFVTTIEVIVGVVVGALIAVFVLTVASARR
jgi:Flp pilus assembly protein TadB